jgi:hypothetical protein
LKCREKGKQSDTDATAFTNAIKDLKLELLDNFKSVSDTLSSFKAEVVKEFSAVNGKIDSLTKDSKKKEKEIEELNNQLANINYQVNAQDQYSRNKNIELDNVHEVKGEDIENILFAIAKKLSIDLSSADIEAAHRLRSNNKDRPPRIIVQFASRKKRNEFIESRRKPITNYDITGRRSDGQDRVFINENLTSFNRELLWRAKVRQKEVGFKYVWWSRAGRVLAKRDDNCKEVISIVSFEDLDKICTE